MSTVVTTSEGLEMLSTGNILELGQAANNLREQMHPGNIVTFVIDRNINYTNICTSACRFCAFYRPVGHAEGYTLPEALIFEKLQETIASGGTQVMLQGGLNPALGLSYYINLLQFIKKNFDIIIHSFSPAEIIHIASKEGLSVVDTLARLKAAGLDSLPGGGAEILVDAVRQRVSPNKISAGDWLSVMEAAHQVGLQATATMVIGMGETYAERMEHMEKVRTLQEKTGVFRAFIIWSYQPGNTQLGGEKISAWDYLKTLSVARLYFNNIKHIQGSWVTQGQNIGQLTLAFGANDLGSIMLEENVVRAAGTSYQMSIDKMLELIRATGKKPAQRDTQYKIIKTF